MQSRPEYFKLLRRIEAMNASTMCDYNLLYNEWLARRYAQMKQPSLWQIEFKPNPYISEESALKWRAEIIERSRRLGEPYGIPPFMASSWA